MEEMNEQALNKIKKLFSLAGNNPNAEEANSAMAKAQAMLAKFGMTEEQILLDEKLDTAEEIDLNFDKSNMDGYCRKITYTICNHFKCLQYIRTSRGRSWMAVVGMSKDLQIVKETIMFAFAVYNAQFKKFMKEFKKTAEWKVNTDSNFYNCGQVSTYSKRVRADFFKGFLAGMDEKFIENEKSCSLIVVTPFAVKERVNKMKFTNSSYKGLCGSGNSEAFEKGKSEGRQVGSKQKVIA